MRVKVTFVYEPEDSDPDHKMGVSDEEYEKVSEKLMMTLGAEDIDFEKVPE
jgi:hypothetical protein